MGTLTMIIILGIISSIIGKVKANKPKTPKKPFSVNNLNEIRELFTGKPEQNQVKQQVEKQTESTRVNIRKKYQSARGEIVVNPPVEVVEEAVKVEQVTSPLNVKTDRLTTPSEADRIINGIIWSEILGSPRAKKTYFSSKR